MSYDKFQVFYYSQKFEIVLPALVKLGSRKIKSEIIEAKKITFEKFSVFSVMNGVYLIQFCPNVKFT